MGRIRTIKPEFHTHEELSELPPETHLLAAALLNYADDEGYFNANPGLVKAGTNPLRSDKTGVTGQLKQLEDIGYIKISRKGNKQYGLVVEFDKHQKVSHPTPSKLRDKFVSLQNKSGEPPENFRPEQGTGNRELKGNREASTANAVPADPGKIIGTLPLNDGTDWKVYAADADELQPLYPAVDVRQELRSMKGWLIGNPTLRKTKRGIGRFITAWLDKEQDKAGGAYAKTSNKSDRTLDALRASLAADDQGRTGSAGDFAQGRVIEGGTGPLRGGAGELGDARPPSRP